MTQLFLAKDELAILTGRKLKSYQIDTLRRMATPFFCQRYWSPTVARIAIKGGSKRPRIR